MSERRDDGLGPLEFALIVLCIMGVTVIVMPSLIRHPDGGSATSSCESNEKNAGTAFEMYSTDNKGQYPPRMAMLTPNYLEIIPTCPGAGTDTYSASYQVRWRPDDGYSFYCSGEVHSAVLGLDNYPQYNSVQGLVSGH